MFSLVGNGYLYKKLGLLGWKILSGTGRFAVGISNWGSGKSNSVGA
jgi:hypothetical protein